MATFTDLLRDEWCAWRKSERFNQELAAEVLGIDPSTLSQWENKKKELPPIRCINKIVEILEDAGRLPNLVEEPKSNVVWVKCPECTQTVPGVIGAKRFHHCAACGESLGKICDNPNCHHLNRFTAKYCEACGYALKTHNTDYRMIKDPHIRHAAENNNKPPKP